MPKPSPRIAAVTVHLRPAATAQPFGQLVEHQRRALPRAGQMRSGRIVERPELGEIASATEGSAVATQHHLIDRRVEPGHLQRVQQRRPGVGGEGVVALRSVEPDVQGVGVTFGLHWIRQQRHRRRAALGQPAGEFRPGLQRGIGQGLGDQPAEHRCCDVETAQYVVAHGRGLRPALAPLSQRV
jgi:hypothetical protein